MAMKRDLFPVIQSRATHGALVEAKSRSSDDVQRRPGRCTKPRNVAGVLWNLWLNQSNRNHCDRTVIRQREVEEPNQVC